MIITEIKEAKPSANEAQIPNTYSKLRCHQFAIDLSLKKDLKKPCTCKYY